jgi:hypothetical protein
MQLLCGELRRECGRNCRKYRAGVIKVTPRPRNFDVRRNLATILHPAPNAALLCINAKMFELAVMRITARAVCAQQKCVGVVAIDAPENFPMIACCSRLFPPRGRDG